MAQLVEDWYKQMPIITRSYLTLSVLTTAGCALEVLSLSLSLSHCILWVREIWHRFPLVASCCAAAFHDLTFASYGGQSNLRHCSGVSYTEIG